MDEPETIQDDDPRLYEVGFLCSHASEEGGPADVGMSVGLGGSMLFAGEIVGRAGWALAIYPDDADSARSDIAEDIDCDAAGDMISAIAAAFARLTVEWASDLVKAGKERRKLVARAEKAEAAAAGLAEALRKAGEPRYGLQSIQEDYGYDTNAYNHHALKYYIGEMDRLRVTARTALAAYAATGARK